MESAIRILRRRLEDTQREKRLLWQEFAHCLSGGFGNRDDMLEAAVRGGYKWAVKQLTEVSAEEEAEIEAETEAASEEGRYDDQKAAEERLVKRRPEVLAATLKTVRRLIRDGVSTHGIECFCPPVLDYVDVDNNARLDMLLANGTDLKQGDRFALECLLDDKVAFGDSKFTKKLSGSTIRKLLIAGTDPQPVLDELLATLEDAPRSDDDLYEAGSESLFCHVCQK